MKDAYRLVSERKENPGVATQEERTKFNAWDKELEQVQEQIDLALRMEKLDLVTAASTAVTVESDANKEKKFNENVFSTLSR